MELKIGWGLPATTREQILSLADANGLPYIRGKWYHVDPTNGSLGASGNSEKHAMKNLEGEYRIAKTTGVQTVISFEENTPAKDTITRTTGSFLTDGFAAGDVIRVSGSTSNDGSYTIYSVTALVITLIATDDLTAEVAGDNVTIIVRDTTWIEGALEKMVDGDGLVLHSYGATSASTTSYLTLPLDVDVNGITVFGDCAPSSVFQRSRLANKRVTTGAQVNISFVDGDPAADTLVRTYGSWIADGFKPGQKIVVSGSTSNDGAYTIAAVTDLVITLIDTDALTTEVAGDTVTVINYMPYLVDVSGQNQRFYNLCGWNADADALSLGGLRVSGSRFAFINVHFTGGAGCTATANEWSLELYGAACQDGDFYSCTFGSDTVERGNNANCEIKLNGTIATARIRFHGGECQAMANGGTAHLAIKSAAATSVGRNIVFDRMRFYCYVENLGADQASVFGGTGLTTAKLCFDNCSMFGYDLYDAATGNDCCFVSSPQGVAAGGKGIVAS